MDVRAVLEFAAVTRGLSLFLQVKVKIGRVYSDSDILCDLIVLLTIICLCVVTSTESMNTYCLCRSHTIDSPPLSFVCDASIYSNYLMTLPRLSWMLSSLTTMPMHSGHHGQRSFCTWTRLLSGCWVAFLTGTPSISSSLQRGDTSMSTTLLSSPSSLLFSEAWQRHCCGHWAAGWLCGGVCWWLWPWGIVHFSCWAWSPCMRSVESFFRTGGLLCSPVCSTASPLPMCSWPLGTQRAYLQLLPLVGCTSWRKDSPSEPAWPSV